MLSAIEGEKDPRNLLICFDLVHFMLLTYMTPSSHLCKETAKEVFEQLLESFFDFVACYFPINFRPPKNDTHKITPERLQGLLSKCMLATPLMLNNVVPMLLEKLSATQTLTKVESLNVLGQVVQKFSLRELVDEGTGGNAGG